MPEHVRQELLVKEALHIQITPTEEHFNQNGGLVAGLQRCEIREEHPH